MTGVILFSFVLGLVASLPISFPPSPPALALATDSCPINGGSKSGDWRELLWKPVQFFNCGCLCSPCPCVPASSFQIDIAGTANNACANCANFDGTYYLTASSTECGGSLSVDCVWKYSNLAMSGACRPGIACDGMCIQLRQINSGGVNTVTVRIFGYDFTFGLGCNLSSPTSAQPRGVFVKDFGAGASDCSVYSALDIPFSANGSTSCSWTGATCTVTAI